MGFKHKVETFPRETIERTPPFNLADAHEHLFAHEYTRVFDETHTHIYTNAYVSDTGLAFHFSTMRMQGITHCMSTSGISKKTYAKMLFQYIHHRTCIRIPKGILITDENSHGYFHWITEVLPKIALHTHHIKSGYTILLPEKYHTPFARESLRMMGITPLQIVVIPPHKKVLVDSLLTTSNLTHPAGAGNYRPDILHVVRTTILSHIDKNSARFKQLISYYGRKLYISRNDAKYRYLKNEEELLPYLKKQGFTSVLISDLSFSEQVLLFSHAHVIMGVHGAGLTNMMWLNPFCMVAEIRRTHDNHNNCYFSLASALKLHYFYSESVTETTHTQFTDFIWDRHSLDVLLTQLNKVT